MYFVVDWRVLLDDTPNNIHKIHKFNISKLFKGFILGGKACVKHRMKLFNKKIMITFWLLNDRSFLKSNTLFLFI